MANNVIEFDTVAYDLGDGKTGYHAVPKVGQTVMDEDYMQEVIDSKGLPWKKDELLHVARAIVATGTEKVAADGRTRMVSDVFQLKLDTLGSFAGPTDKWDPAKNTAVVKARFLKESTRKVDTDKVTMKNVNDGVNVKLNYVTFLGATTSQDVIKALTDIVAYGNNLQFDAAKGDAAWLELRDKSGNALKKFALTFKEGDIAHAVFAFNPEIIGYEGGTEFWYCQTSRGGVEGQSPIPVERAVTYLGYGSPDAYIWDIRTAGLAANTVKIDAEKEVTISGVQLSNAIDATLTLTCKDGTSGKVSIAKADFTKNTNTEVSFLFTEDKLPTALTGHDLAGATGTLLFRSEDGGVVEDYAFQYAE